MSVEWEKGQDWSGVASGLVEVNSFENYQNGLTNWFVEEDGMGQDCLPLAEVVETAVDYIYSMNDFQPNALREKAAKHKDSQFDVISLVKGRLGGHLYREGLMDFCAASDEEGKTVVGIDRKGAGALAFIVYQLRLESNYFGDGGSFEKKSLRFGQIIRQAIVAEQSGGGDYLSVDPAVIAARKEAWEELRKDAENERRKNKRAADTDEDTEEMTDNLHKWTRGKVENTLRNLRASNLEEYHDPLLDDEVADYIRFIINTRLNMLKNSGGIAPDADVPSIADIRNYSVRDQITAFDFLLKIFYEIEKGKKEKDLNLEKIQNNLIERHSGKNNSKT